MCDPRLSDNQILSPTMYDPFVTNQIIEYLAQMLTHYTTAQEIAILKPRLIDDGVLTNNDSGPKKRS